MTDESVESAIAAMHADADGLEHPMDRASQHGWADRITRAYRAERAALSRAGAEAELDACQRRLNELADEYEWGDGYVPKRRERLLLIDFANGILSDKEFLEAARLTFRAPPPAVAQVPEERCITCGVIRAAGGPSYLCEGHLSPSQSRDCQWVAAAPPASTYRNTGEHDGVVVNEPAPVAASEREQLAAWMARNSYATGHGDTIADLIASLDWQHAERTAPVAADGWRPTHGRDPDCEDEYVWVVWGADIPWVDFIELGGYVEWSETTHWKPAEKPAPPQREKE